LIASPLKLGPIGSPETWYETTILRCVKSEKRADHNTLPLWT